MTPSRHVHVAGGTRVSPRVALLISLIDEAFDRRAWHGPALRSTLRGITAAQAAWRPGPGRHNIWELTVHAAYWKHIVRRRIAGAPRNSFGHDGSNWFVRPDGHADEQAWRADVLLLVDEHRRLRDAVLQMTDRALDRRVRSRDTAAFTIRGIAAHDLYHAGQIQLLKRLQARARSR